MAKILVVDDEYGIIDVCKLRLESVGYNVFTAETIEEGKSVYDNKNPDLVICDYLLNGKIGKILLDHIREKDKEANKHTPFILFSCMDEAKINPDFKPDDFLPKPFDSKDLCNIVEKHLKK